MNFVYMYLHWKAIINDYLGQWKMKMHLFTAVDSIDGAYEETDEKLNETFSWVPVLLPVIFKLIFIPFTTELSSSLSRILSPYGHHNLYLPRDILFGICGSVCQAVSMRVFSEIITPKLK